MTRFVAALGLVWLVTVPLTAQTATPTSKFTIDQGAPDLATATSYTFKLYADGSATGTVVPMTCTGATSPFTCTTAVSAFTPGTHTVTFTASNAAGESVKSAPLTFQMVIVPSAPANPRIS